MLIGQQIGPFAVERELGCGAMGAVYLARYTKTGTRVAIKVMAPGLCTNKTALARFEREAAILKQLKHANIVRLYASGRYHSTPFYAMEYIQGESLDHVMARRGRITWEQLVALGQQLCAGLQHAHEKGIVHRDLKPSNLMVLPDETVKLTDFGIAKDLDVTALTSANCTVGTAAYMSPEQCKGERDLTHKSDLYSMGVMFYELLTGRKPFQAETAMDMFMQHVNGTFERPSRLVPEIPIWLDTLICQLLEKQPDKRPLDAAAVGEALGRIREKVEAQQSAGVDAAKRRVIDRAPNQEKFDEADKEAARALLRKKPKKKKAKPFYTRGWFQGAGILAVLAGIVWVIYFTFFTSPSPQSLREQAERLVREDPEGGLKEARKGPVQRFLDLYPDLQGPDARAVHELADRADREQTERSLYARLNFKALDDDERQARVAVEQEAKGDLEAARDSWAKLAPYQAEKDDREKRGWGLLAAQRLDTLKRVQDEEDRLRGKLGQHPDHPGKALDGAGKEESLALQGMHAEKDDPAGARKHWQELKQLSEAGRERRVWYLLAAKHLAQLTDKQS